MRMLTNVLIVMCEYVLWLIMYLLMLVSGALLWVMNRISEACVGLQVCIEGLRGQLCV